MRHESKEIPQSPTFINLQPLDISPLISSCEIKIAYVGKNRNGSMISKEVLTNIAKTLRGNPIVGYYNLDKEDFVDHGEQIIIDHDGVKRNCLTVPYGFVAPNAEVWFQSFEEKDDFDNTVIREYLMTTGYLWTGQFEECKKVIQEGRPQSMEFDENMNFKGYWSEDCETGMEFFVLTDAVFSKLCILGDDVEPCFEGASVTAPQVSEKFTVNEDFMKTFSLMKTELQNLKKMVKGGDDTMEKEKEKKTTQVKEDPEKKDDKTTQAKEQPEEKSAPEKNEPTAPQDKTEPAPKDDKNGEGEKEDPKKKHSAEDTDAKIKDLMDKFSKATEDIAHLNKVVDQLTSENNQLKEFKNSVEDQKKDEMINSFYMLSDEDKKDVIENKSKYSLDDIEAKLSVMCFRKKVNFTNDKTDKDSVLTYNLQSAAANDVPDYIKALRAVKEN